MCFNVNWHRLDKCGLVLFIPRVSSQQPPTTPLPVCLLVTAICIHHKYTVYHRKKSDFRELMGYKLLDQHSFMNPPLRWGPELLVEDQLKWMPSIKQNYFCYFLIDLSNHQSVKICVKKKVTANKWLLLHRNNYFNPYNCVWIIYIRLECLKSYIFVCKQMIIIT